MRIMNQLIAVAVFGVLATSAHATEKDLKRQVAVMKIFEQTGIFEKVKNVTVVKTTYLEPVARCLAMTPECLEAPEYREVTQLAARVGSTLMTFSSQLKVEKDSCGSTRYTAVQNVRSLHPVRITLVDHATRLCENYRPYQFESTFTVDGPMAPGVPVSVLRALGNPKVEHVKQ